MAVIFIHGLFLFSQRRINGRSDTRVRLHIINTRNKSPLAAGARSHTENLSSPRYLQLPSAPQDDRKPHLKQRHLLAHTD